jgi:hypothetical protein
MFRFWHGFTPKVGTVCSSEMLVSIYQTIRRHSPEYCDLSIQSIENPKSKSLVCCVYLDFPSEIRTCICCKTVFYFTHGQCRRLLQLSISFNLGTTCRTASESQVVPKAAPSASYTACLSRRDASWHLLINTSFPPRHGHNHYLHRRHNPFQFNCETQGPTRR